MGREGERFSFQIENETGKKRQFVIENWALRLPVTIARVDFKDKIRNGVYKQHNNKYFVAF